MLLQVGFDAAEFVEKLVVLQDLKILHMEVSFGVSLEALVGLPRINAFQDTKLPEVLQIHLQGADGI